MPLEKLPGRRYRVDRDVALVGEGRRYTVGQPLRVTVTLADEVLGRIELEPAAETQTTQPRGKRAGQRKRRRPRSAR